MTLKNPTEAELIAWILAIMRAPLEGQQDSARYTVAPDDRVFVMHGNAGDARRARIETATLGEVALGDLRAGTDDARAVQQLAELTRALELNDAVTMLQAITERGELGGHIGALDHAAEESVLSALADMQAPRVLYEKWAALWTPRHDLARLWEVTIAGLRTSDPVRALEVLPLLLARSLLPLSPRFDLGSALWGWHVDEAVAGPYASALDALPAEDRQRCREAIAWMEREDDDAPAPTSDPTFTGGHGPADPGELDEEGRAV